MVINAIGKLLSNVYLSIILFTYNVVLALNASQLKQCCDAIAYLNESTYIFSGQANIAQAHNYGYPLYLKLSNALGADGKSMIIASVSVSLLLCSALFFAKTCKRYFQIKNNYLYSVVLIFCVPISYAFSGFYLTEALIAPLFFILLNLLIIYHLKIVIKSKIFIYISIVSISSFAWMVRPALLWLPIVLILLLNFSINLSTLQRFYRVLLGLFAMFMFALPQYILVSTQPRRLIRPWIDGVLHLNLAQGQSNWSENIYRYATNLSSCGEPAFNFSPNNLDNDQALNYQYEYGIFQKSASYLMHFVSGWDALPGPSYIQEISYFPWIFVTIISGFFLASPIILTYFLLSKKIYIQSSQKNFATVLLALFSASQVVLLSTATEFRFNLLGWFICALIWIFLLSTLKANLKMKPISLLASMLSLTIIIIGQYTLNLSNVWKNCI